MDFPHYRSLILTLLLLACVTAQAQEDNPCNGPNALLALVNRPSVLESACTVPEKNVVLEMGSFYEFLTDSGTQNNLPQAVFRYGLSTSFEFDVTIPNYIHQTVDPKAGFTAAALSLKHELFVHEKWLSSIEGVCILPSGSDAFGAQNPGGVFNSITTYNLTDVLGVTAMVGISALPQSQLNGGGNYFSVNPIILLSWSKDKTSIYGEVSGQTKTAVDEGSGFNFDMGLIYLVKQNITVDIEYAHRLSGNLGGYNHYVGAGFAIQFN